MSALPSGRLEARPLMVHPSSGPGREGAREAVVGRALAAVHPESLGHHLQELLCSFLPVVRVGGEGSGSSNEQKKTQCYRKPHCALQEKEASQWDAGEIRPSFGAKGIQIFFASQSYG